MLWIYIRDKETGRYLRHWAGEGFIRKYDNSCLISIGLQVFYTTNLGFTFGDIDQATFDRWYAWAEAGRPGWEVVTRDQWAHSSCGSGCILRGDPKCVW